MLSQISAKASKRRASHWTGAVWVLILALGSSKGEQDMSIIDRALGRSQPGEDDHDAAVAQWNFFGRIAGIFCLWAMFIIPILLVIDLLY